MGMNTNNKLSDIRIDRTNTYVEHYYIIRRHSEDYISPKRKIHQALWVVKNIKTGRVTIKRFSSLRNKDKESHVNMMQRCYNKKTQQYKDYGGRDSNPIKVEEYLQDYGCYKKFIKTLEHYNDDNYTLNRIDNDGDYTRFNLEFSSVHVQNTNQRICINNASGYVGISWGKKAKKWLSQITVNYKQTNLGQHNTKEDALKARNDYIIENGLTEYEIQEYEGEDKVNPRR